MNVVRHTSTAQSEVSIWPRKGNRPAGILTDEAPIVCPPVDSRRVNVKNRGPAKWGPSTAGGRSRFNSGVRIVTDSSAGEPRPLTVKEAAARIGIHYQTLYGWIRDEQVEVIRYGRSIRIREAEVQRLIDEHTVPPKRPVAGWSYSSPTYPYPERYPIDDEPSEVVLDEWATGTPVQPLTDKDTVGRRPPSRRRRH